MRRGQHHRRQADRRDHQHDDGVDAKAGGGDLSVAPWCGRRDSRRPARRPRWRRETRSARYWRRRRSRHSRVISATTPKLLMPALERPSSMKKNVSMMIAGVMMLCLRRCATVGSAIGGTGIGNADDHQQQRHQRADRAGHDQRAEAADRRHQRGHDRGRDRAAEEARKGVDRKRAAHPPDIHMRRKDRVVGRDDRRCWRDQAARRTRSARRSSDAGRAGSAPARRA